MSCIATVALKDRKRYHESHLVINKFVFQIQTLRFKDTQSNIAYNTEDICDDTYVTIILIPSNHLMSIRHVYSQNVMCCDASISLTSRW